MSRYLFVMAEGTFDGVDIERTHLAGHPVDVTMARLATAEDVERETADADAVIVAWNPLPAELIDRLGPKLRIIGRCGIGLDAIDLDAAQGARPRRLPLPGLRDRGGGDAHARDDPRLEPQARRRRCRCAT